MSLKVHIIIHHYRDYFEWTGKNFRYTNGEFVEASHYSIKNEDKTHNFKVTRGIGTPIHREKLLKSMIWHNSKRTGLTPPGKFTLRNSNNGLYSSPK